MRPATRAYGAPFDDEGPTEPADLRLRPHGLRAGDVEKVMIHHVDTGAPAGVPEAPAVVLLPGVVSTHRYFRENVPALSARWRVIALDLPGFGRSEKPDAPYTPDWYAARLLDFLDAKGIARAHLVGNSLGGQVAMRIAATHPERVGRLVLVAPAGFMPYTEVLTRVMGLAGKAAFPETGLPRLPRIPRAALGLLFRAAFPTRPDLVERWVRGYAAGVASPEYPLYVRAAYRSMRGSLRTPMDETARAITAPTLIMWGARDRILPPAAAHPLARTIPGAHLIVYADAGHCPMIDQADRWNHDVIRFLAAEDG